MNSINQIQDPVSRNKALYLAQSAQAKPETPQGKPIPAVNRPPCVWPYADDAQPQGKPAQPRKPDGASHSALPWELDATDWPLIINDNGDSCVALVESKEYNGRDYSCQSETALANAKLIVASVNHVDKLADALRAVVYTWENDFKGQQTGYEGTPLETDYKQAKAALAEYERSKQ